LATKWRLEILSFPLIHAFLFCFVLICFHAVSLAMGWGALRASSQGMESTHAIADFATF